ncbi:MAG: HigA family addiction module antidote protein, partial [Chloroflexi bacterium]|nr:HigA family addiction module antidote protein [Chloroflexota bacterium]
MATREKIYSDQATPPGESLAELLEVLGISQRELAVRSGRPEQAISEIINGKKAITAETALQLEKVLGTPSSFWVNLESRYQETLARIRETAELAEQEAQLDAFPIREMKQRGLLPDTRDKGALLKGLLGFLGVASFDALEARQAGVLGYRVTPAARVSPGALFVWMREGELAAAEIKTQPYDQRRFMLALRELRALTIEESWPVAYSRMVEVCAGAGVALVITRSYPKSGASGVARWLAADKAMIQLSTRRNYVDMFWFSLFHEAKHVLARQKRRVFVNDINDQDDEEA